MVSTFSRHRILSPIIAVALSLGGIATAKAESALLVLGGGAPEHERTTVGGGIENEIRSAGWSTASKPTKKEIDGLLNCKDVTTPWTCVPSSIRSRGVGGVFVISVDMTQAPNGAPLVVVTGRMIVVEPPQFTFGQRYCEHCADDKLTEAGANVARQLIDDLATRAGRTVAHFTSEPTGADIILDGTKLGATEATYSTRPGKHTAMVQKAGYVSQVKEFTVETGKTADVAFTLVPSDAVAAAQKPHTQPPPASRAYLLPAVAIGAGASLATIGGALIYRGLVGSDQYEYPRALTVGIPIELVGLGAVGAGLYLLWRGDRNSGITANATPGGAVVGWSGRF
jgi:hypothetical protein